VLEIGILAADRSYREMSCRRKLKIFSPNDVPACCRAPETAAGKNEKGPNQGP